MAPKLVSESPLNGTPKPMVQLIAVINAGVGYMPQYNPAHKEYLSTLKEHISTALLAKAVRTRTLDDFPIKVVELSPASPAPSELDLAITADQPTHVIRMTVVRAEIYNGVVPLRVTWQVEVFQAKTASEKSIQDFSSISRFSFEGPGCNSGMSHDQCATKLASALIESLQRKGFLRS